MRCRVNNRIILELHGMTKEEWVEEDLQGRVIGGGFGRGRRQITFYNCKTQGHYT